MATSRIIPLHIGKGRTLAKALNDILAYSKNPDKTDNSRFISSHECDKQTIEAEFLLAKRQYEASTGRKRSSDDVIAYQLRQAFPPGEITPEKANEIGHELALAFTKGKHAFIVCTHVDKHHIHNHIIFNSTTMDCSRKFRKFWGSSWALRRISDRICLEHGQSIIENPQPSRGHYGKWQGEYKKPSFHEQIRRAIDEIFAESKPADMDEFVRRMEAKGFKAKRGKHLAFLAPGAKKYARCDTLKGDYTERAIQERIEGTRVTANRDFSDEPHHDKSVNLLVDIDAAIRAGKGKGYERWAKVFNAKQLANAINYLRANAGLNMKELEQKAAASAERFNNLSDCIKQLESKMRTTAALQKQIINYSRTRSVYVAYRRAGYSKKFRAEHESEILIHQAAKSAFDKLGLKKLPSVTSLKKEYSAMLAEKNSLYSEYKKARVEMLDAQNAKANIEMLLGANDKRRDSRERVHDR